MPINDHLKATDIVIYLDSNLDFEDEVILIKIGALFDQISWRIKDIPSVFIITLTPILTTKTGSS